MAIYDPYKAMQEARLRDPSLDLSAQATPYIGEGGGVGGKGGGRADDPGAFDDFGRNDPYGGGLLYRMPSQRDPGIVADLQRQVEQNRLGSILSGLMGRGGGDTPPLDTGYNINVNVVADLLKGLAGSPDRTPTGQAAVTESPTTQSQLSPEAQAQGNAFIAQVLRDKAEEVSKLDPDITYPGAEGKIASLGNVTTDQGGGQLAGTAITPLRETLDVDPDLLEKAQYDARVKSGEIVPPPDDAAELERLFSEISKTPIRPVRPAIDEIQLRQDLLSQPPPGKPWDQLTEEEQQDLYNKAIEQGKKKELEKAAAQAGAGLYGTGRGIMQGEWDLTKPPPPEGVLANLMHLLKDPGFQKLAATGIIAATGGAGRGREAQAAVKAIEQGEALRLKRETLRQEQADKLRTRQIEAERISREKFNKYLDLVKSGASPAVVGPLFNMNPEQMVRGMLIASQMYEKENAHRVDQLTGDIVFKDDPRWKSAVGFPTQGEALKMSEQIKEARVGEGNWATPLLRDLDKVHEEQQKLNDRYRDNGMKKEEFDNQTEANKRILNFLNSKLKGTQSNLEAAVEDVFKDDPEGLKKYREDIVEKSRRVPQDKPPEMITTWGVGPDGEPKLASITGGTPKQQEQAIAKAVLVGQQKKGFELIDSSIRVMRLIQKMVPVTDVFSVVPLYAKIQGWKNVITEIFGESMAEITREDADQILSDAQIDAAKTTEARYKEQGLVYSPEKTVNLYKIRQQYEDYFASKGLKTNMYRFSSLMVALSVKLAKLEEGSRLTDEDIIRQRDKILGVVAGVPPTPASVFQGLGVAMEASVYDLQEGSRMAKTTAEDQLKLRGLDDLIQYLPQLEKGERTKKLEQEDRHKQRISNWKTQFESEVGEIPSYLKDSIDPSGKITKSFGVNMRQTTGGWIRADLPEGRNIYEVMTSKDKEGSLMFEFILGE